jgi:hypothetical protein
MGIKSRAFKIYVFLPAAAALVSAGAKCSVCRFYILYHVVVSPSVPSACARASHENNIHEKKGIHRWMGLYINFQFVLTLL